MKKLILISIFTFLLFTTQAQWSGEWLSKDNKHLLYANGDLMVGNNSGGNVGLCFVYDSKFSVEVGYSAGSNQISSKFPVLKSGSTSEMENQKTPAEMMENFNIMFGRHFNLNSKETIRFILQGGPGMSSMMNWMNEQQGSSTSDFVRYELESTKDISITINSKFEFPITDLFGFSVGPTLILNHEKSFLSFSVGFMYGVISKS
jgi:hypothetical protein